MKLALLLTGHYRTFDETYPEWEKTIIKKHSTDLYFHIWDNVGNRTDLEKGEASPTLGALARASFDNDKVDFNKLNNVSNLIVENYFEVEQKEDFNNRIKPVKEEFSRRGLGDRRIKWFLSQYYKRLKGIEWVLNQKEKYDLVLLSRPDFMLNYYPGDARSSAPKKSFDTINFNSLMNDKLGLTLLNEIDGYHDFYMIGKPEIILECCSIYNSFELLFDYFKQYDMGKMSCGHSLLTTFIKYKQFNVEQLPLLGYIKR